LHWLRNPATTLLAKPSNAALERLAQVTTNKGTVMASPLQALVMLISKLNTD
jgi:hypothetical protein